MTPTLEVLIASRVDRLLTAERAVLERESRRRPPLLALDPVRVNFPMTETRGMSGLAVDCARCDGQHSAPGTRSV